jgi:modulator of drug activity B
MAAIHIVCGAEVTAISEGRFNRALVAEAQDVLGAAGHGVTVTDVEEGFDVAAEQEAYRAADAVILQFPVFWFAVPSGLKRYFDTVYQRKVFYQRALPYGAGGLLGGRRYMLSTTWNAPPAAFDDADAFFEGRSVDGVLFPVHKAQQYIGLEPLPSFHALNVISEPDYARHAARFRAHLTDVFGP